MKAYVEAYGCTLSFGESREIEDMLASRGWSIISSPDEADLAVLSTCVVIDKTERAMLRRLKALRSVPRLIVTGCMATACREQALAAAPNALFVAPGDMSTLSALTRDGFNLESASKIHRDSYGIVPIATGCLGSCSYCITRIARGALRSRSPEAIANRVRELVAGGPREVQLTAQDTAAYGADIGDSLSDLVARLCSIPGDFRLRVGMMNPRTVLPRIDSIVEMYREAKVFKFLHLPVQSGSDKILEAMGRGYTVQDFRGIVEKVREAVPSVTLSTDLIVGYPGETQEDHEANIRLVADVAPDIVNVTKYSSRPGTKAAQSKGVVGWKAKERSRELTRVRFKVALEKNLQWMGKEVVALSTEFGKNGSTIFRTDEYKQVVVPGIHPLGRFQTVVVTDATPTYLRGELEGSG